MRSNTGTRPQALRSSAVLIGILLLAYTVRVVGLQSESLWIDEGYSLALAGHGVHDIVRGTAADQHPPLYYLILRSWLLPGQSVFYSRYLSVLFGVLGVAVTVLLARVLLGGTEGSVAGLLLACSPIHVWYSQEVRMYALLTLFTTLSCFTTWRMTHREKGWFVHVIVSLLALFTHYFAVFVLIAQSIYVLGRWLLCRDGARLTRWVSAQAVVAMLFAPWVPTALYQARTHTMTWIHAPTARDLHHTLRWMVLGDSGTWWSSAVLDGGLILIALVLILGSLRTRRPTRYCFLWLLFGVPFVTITGISQVYPIFQPKQFLLLVPPMLILLSSVLTGQHRALGWILLGALIVVTLGSTISMGLSPSKDGWREAARVIEKNYQEGDLLFLNPAAGKGTLDVYLSPMPAYAGYPPGYDIIAGGWQGERVTADIAHETLAPLALEHERIWLVDFTAGFWDPEGHLVSWLQDHGQLELDRSFRGVRVRAYSVGIRQETNARNDH